MGAAGTVLLCCLAQIFLLTNSFKIGRVRHSFLWLVAMLANYKGARRSGSYVGQLFLGIPAAEGRVLAKLRGMPLSLRSVCLLSPSRALLARGHNPS